MILANITLPRDFSFFPIGVAWFIILVWVCIGVDRRNAFEQGEYQIASWVMRKWLGMDRDVPPPPRTGLERIRNGWTLIVSTVVAAGLIYVIYATNPYMWSL